MSKTKGSGNAAWAMARHKEFLKAIAKRDMKFGPPPPAPKTCCVCGGVAIYMFSNVGACRKHKEKAVEAAKRWNPLWKFGEANIDRMENTKNKVFHSSFYKRNR